MTGFSPLQHEADGLGAGLPPLMVAADRLAASISLGVHGRRRAGIGENFWQFRRYQNEDAARIDWRQSAKSQHLYVREREWESAQTVWLWRDGGAGMDFASGKVSKRERAELLLLGLASLLVRGGERVGFLGGGERPTASRLALIRIAQSLLDGKKRAQAMPPSSAVTRGATMVWLSDFLEEDAIETLRGLSRAGISGHLVRIVDPAEEDFPYHGRARFESVRGTSSNENVGAALFGRAESVGDAYRARFRAHGEELSNAAMRLGWTCTTHRTDHAPLRALIALHAAIGMV
jgi:uncharacterized protein (DUF58 family)